jgi:4-hydroxy-3-methylbut-2-en-1-yl diphosphate reductase
VFSKIFFFLTFSNPKTVSLKDYFSLYICIRNKIKMKQFQIPAYYRSPIISQVKSKRKALDPRKKDFTPTVLDFGTVKFLIARHFGFCYGVENAIEIAYRAISENQGKRIFLLSQMIHNPGVNEDLMSYGIQFIQDTKGNQLIPWSDINAEDIVIIPAFGTTIEIESKLTEIGVDVKKYNTTCPFVEKVWNRAETLGKTDHTIIIHGKASHEETRATFSHANVNAPSLIIKDLKEAKILGEFIRNKRDLSEFDNHFQGKYSTNFDPKTALNKIGVVNQTTMLASETQEIADYLKNQMLIHVGEAALKNHFADTRDTLCYATNDNQSATLGLLEETADFAIVVGGNNSSNTTHLVELLEDKFKVYFIQSEQNILDNNSIDSFNIHTKSMENLKFQIKDKPKTIILTSGASCPDSIIDNVIQKLLQITGSEKIISEILNLIH